MTDDINKLEKTKDCLQEINVAEDVVRRHISTNRYQSKLIQNASTWGQICSSLDIIGDTVTAISSYIDNDYPQDQGLKYISTYGILQTLFLQQDAIGNLTEAFGYEFTRSSELIKIRDLRNASIGHPTKQNISGTTYHNYISRMTMQKYGFTLLRSNSKGQDEFVDVDIVKILNQQLLEIRDNIHLINAKLQEEDRMHKEQYKDSLISDVFHSSMPYVFQKIIEGIHSGTHHNKDFALKMLNIAKETYQKFRVELSNSGELNEYIDYDLKVYEHALSALDAYLSDKKPDMSVIDARIYFSYIQENHNHFLKVAKEIDDEYQEKNKHN